MLDVQKLLLSKWPLKVVGSQTPNVTSVIRITVYSVNISDTPTVAVGVSHHATKGRMGSDRFA